MYVMYLSNNPVLRIENNQLFHGHILHVVFIYCGVINVADGERSCNISFLQVQEQNI